MTDLHGWPRHVQISDNSVYLASDGYGISLESIQDVTVADNDVVVSSPTADYSSGITLRATTVPAERVVISGNRVRATAGRLKFGIRVAAAPQDVGATTFMGNTIDHAQVGLAHEGPAERFLVTPVVMGNVVTQTQIDIQAPVAVVIGGNSGASSPRILMGKGSPEGLVASAPGSMFLSKDGAAYLKTSCTDATGWSTI